MYIATPASSFNSSVSYTISIPTCSSWQEVRHLLSGPHIAAACLPKCWTTLMTRWLLSSAVTPTAQKYHINPINSRLHLNFHQFSISQLKLNIISKLSSSFCRLHHLVPDWIGLVWINLNYISSLSCISLTLSIFHLTFLNIIRCCFFFIFMIIMNLIWNEICDNREHKIHL